MNLLQSLRRGERHITTIDEYAAALGSFTYAGTEYPVTAGYGLNGAPAIQQTLSGQKAEPIPQDFIGFAQGALKSNGVIFACMLVRQLVFSTVRFQYQRFNGGRPSELWGDGSLSLFEQPWAGGTTQDLLARMIQDADLAGNSYWTVRGGEMVRLRPDWVQIILEPRLVPSISRDEFGRVIPAPLGYKRFGYVYTEGGPHADAEPIFLTPDEVAHFAPIPDPTATYRGMSWLTPIIREIQADGMMTRHRIKFFENGATPNLLIKHPETASLAKVQAFRDALNDAHQGVENAYKTMHLGGGADATVIGADFKQIEFKVTQGAGETRIAAAAGVPPIIVGLSEGLESATYSNYGQARRRLADGTMHPLWGNACGSMQRLARSLPPGTRLWYDARDVPFLREDSKDAATILETNARTIAALVNSGYTPESVMRAVNSGDLGLLVHTGLYSVQLQKPGSDEPPAVDANTPAALEAAP